MSTSIDKHVGFIEDITVEDEREYNVIKSNDLARTLRCNLTQAQFRLFCFMVSRVKPSYDACELKDGLSGTFSMDDYCLVCGLAINRVTYQRMKADLMKIYQESAFWIHRKGEDSLYSFISNITIDHKSHLVHYTIAREMLTFITNMDKRFSQYRLIEVLPMNSLYSVRLFELLNSYAYEGEHYLELKLFSHLFVDSFEKDGLKPKRKSYEKFCNLHRRILAPAVEEINAYTHLNVTYKLVTEGRQVSGILFRIQEKPGHDIREIFQSSHALLDKLCEPDG